MRDLMVQEVVVVGRVQSRPSQENQGITPVHAAVSDLVFVDIHGQDDEIGQRERGHDDPLSAPQPALYQGHKILVRRRVIGKDP